MNGGVTRRRRRQRVRRSPDEALARYPGLRGYDGRKVVVGVRAGDLHPAQSAADLPTINARVELVEALGGESIAYFQIDAHGDPSARRRRRGGARERRARRRRRRRGRTSSPRSRRTSSCSSATRSRSRSTSKHAALLRRGDGCAAPLARSLVAAALAVARRRGGRRARVGAAAGRRARRARAAAGAAARSRSQRIYFVMPDRYANGDPSNDTGGLTGAARRHRLRPDRHRLLPRRRLQGPHRRLHGPVHGLARIKDLGFNAIWVTPPVVNQITTGRLGAATTATGASTSRASTRTSAPNAGLRRLRRTARTALGLKVILDVVVNHTGDIVLLDGRRARTADVPYRDCHGKVVRRRPLRRQATFPCLQRAYMPHVAVRPARGPAREEAGLAERPARTTTTAATSTSPRAARRASSRATSSASTTSSPRSRTS